MRPAQLRVVGTAFLRQRPIVTLPVVIANFTLFALGGAPTEQLVVLAIGLVALQAMFWTERVLGGRGALSQRALVRSVIATTLGLSAGCVATGGLASPLVPLLLAPTGIGFAAFGRTRPSAILLGLLVAVGVGLALVPRDTPFPPLASPYRELATAVGLVASAMLLRLGVAALADAHATAAAALARTGDEAASAVGELDTLGARVAHEVKNPLAAIRGIVEVMMEGRADEERDRKRLSVVAGEVARIEQILRDYLDDARPARELERAVVDVGDIVRDVAAVLEARADRDQVTLVVRGGVARADVDARRLKEAILNLALNALSATGAGEQVELRWRGGPGVTPGVTIEVADTGAGMSADDLARVGTPGFTTRDGGTGLGVVLARRIVEQHGGSLRFTSTPGRGTTATIQL